MKVAKIRVATRGSSPERSWHRVHSVTLWDPMCSDMCQSKLASPFPRCTKLRSLHTLTSSHSIKRLTRPLPILCAPVSYRLSWLQRGKRQVHSWRRRQSGKLRGMLCGRLWRRSLKSVPRTKSRWTWNLVSKKRRRAYVLHLVASPQICLIDLWT